ncbi:MAG: hypothetical protein Q4F67_08270 [Propionibacteriaceae bacterium]|nr:hypothetical protein [Propionibacteriaceae bacterium]
MTNDANDSRPKRAADPAPEQPESGWPEVHAPTGDATRRGWSNYGEPGPADEPTTDSSAPRGTPTPGQQNPAGRPTQNPNVNARPLSGTVPKATNEPPQAPSGSSSAPTAVRRAAEPPREVAPNFQPPPPEAANPPSAAAGSDGDGERPENPFAPKHEPVRKSRLPLGRKHQQAGEQEPVGKRVAEPEPRRISLGRRRSESKAPKLGPRNIVALTIAGVAMVATVALIAATALWWFNRDNEAAAPTGTGLVATPGPVLSSGQMLSETMAKSIDPARTWTQTLDQAGVDDASPSIACTGPLAAGQPVPEITQLRGISGSGDDRTAALHRADAYATSEEAQQVFEFRSAELGSCSDTPLYVEQGMTVTGVGDDALGVRLVLQDTTSEYHTVLLVRTGRVVNMMDVARAGEPADMEAAVRALSQSINRQCGPAVGLCTAPTTSVEVGIPPAGADKEGFMSSGDLPRVSPGTGSWRGNPLATNIDVQDGTSCEAIDFGSIGGTGVTRQQRTYLLRNDAAAPPQFGVDQVVLRMGSPEEASQLVERVHANMTSCNTRTLTSEMVGERELSTTGAGGVEIKGRAYVVNTKIDQSQSQKYRTGVFSSGNKFVYLRSNPTEAFDFSDDAWAGVNLRAGERLTQVE